MYEYASLEEAAKAMRYSRNTLKRWLSGEEPREVYWRDWKFERVGHHVNANNAGRPVIAIAPDGNRQHFRSVSSAHRSLGISGRILWRLAGRCPQALGTVGWVEFSV